MGTELTRRSFLTGLGVAGIAAAGAGLAGCAPAANDSAAATGNGGKAAGANGAAANDTEFIAASYVNPQDTDYRQNTTDFSTLFSPIKIGSIESSHRMIKSAAGSATYLAGLTEEFF